MGTQDGVHVVWGHSGMGTEWHDMWTDSGVVCGQTVVWYRDTVVWYGDMSGVVCGQTVVWYVDRQWCGVWADIGMVWYVDRQWCGMWAHSGMAWYVGRQWCGMVCGQTVVWYGMWTDSGVVCGQTVVWHGMWTDSGVVCGQTVVWHGMWADSGVAWYVGRQWCGMWADSGMVWYVGRQWCGMETQVVWYVDSYIYIYYCGELAVNSRWDWWAGLADASALDKEVKDASCLVDVDFEELASVGEPQSVCPLPLPLQLHGVLQEGLGVQPTLLAELGGEREERGKEGGRRQLKVAVHRERERDQCCTDNWVGYHCRADMVKQGNIRISNSYHTTHNSCDVHCTLGYCALTVPRCADISCKNHSKHG